MAKFEIIVGTVLGASEYVADALQEQLQAHQHSVTIHLQPEFAELDKDATWLVCTSTHGAGELPDNIQPFAKAIENQDLSSVKALIVGLGDSSYDTFCNGAMEMENRLVQAGATLLTSPLHIDVLNHPIPEDRAVEWLNDWIAEQA